MKKILLIPLMLLTMIPMAACSGSNADLILPEQQPENSGSGDEDDSTDPADPTPGGNGRYLVLYCSRTGSTERMAQQIQKILDCDILEVEPQVAYDSDYDGMLSRAQEELSAIRQGNYPAIKTSVEDFDDYDIVFIRSGTVVLPHRCRRSCTIMLRSSQVNVLPFLPPVVVAVSLHRLMRHGCFAPVPLSPKRCF